MMRTGVITVTNPDHTVPTGYLEQVHANNPTAVGFAISDGKELFIQHSARPSVSDLTRVFEACKTKQVSMHLAKYPDGYLAEDMQPFVLVEDANKKPVIAVMLDGDWVSPAPQGANHSDEFFVAMNQLRPMMQQLYKLTKGDINAVLEEIAGDATMNALKNLFIERGSIHLLFNNGKVHTVINNKLERDFDWGWSSNPFMYSEEEPPVGAPPYPESVNPLAALMNSPKPEPWPKPPVTNELFKKEPAIPVSSSTPPTKVKCPPNVTKVHKIEGWYKHHAGWIPKNYMEKPEVEVAPPKVSQQAGPTSKIPAIKDLKDLGTSVRETASRILPDVTSSPADIAKRTPPKIATGPKIVAPVEPIKQPDPVQAPPAAEPRKDIIPSMTPESQKKIIDHWLKETAALVTTTDRSGNAIIDPKEAPAMEAKYTGFADRLGIKFEDTFRWTAERIEKLMYEYPDAMLHLYCDTRQQLAQMMKAQATAPSIGSNILPKIKKAG